MAERHDQVAENLIVSDPQILGGKRCVRGTRLTVEFLLELAASGATQEQILAQYPQDYRRTPSSSYSFRHPIAFSGLRAFPKWIADEIVSDLLMSPDRLRGFFVGPDVESRSAIFECSALRPRAAALQAKCVDEG
jgi:uncharacterized protein (DUF433 family)